MFLEYHPENTFSTIVGGKRSSIGVEASIDVVLEESERLPVSFVTAVGLKNLGDPFDDTVKFRVNFVTLKLMAFGKIKGTIYIDSHKIISCPVCSFIFLLK